MTDPQCVFCGAPWDEPMLENLSVSQGCETCGYGQSVSATLKICCSSCHRVVYVKELRDQD